MTTKKIISMASYVAALPYVLGHYPVNSAIVAGVQPYVEDGAVLPGLTCRFDLQGDDVDLAAAQDALRRMAPDCKAAVVIVWEGPGQNHQDAQRVLCQAVEFYGIEVVAAVTVRDGRLYGSEVAEGERLPGPQESDVVAGFVSVGVVPARSREHMVQMNRPGVGEAARVAEVSRCMDEERMKFDGPAMLTRGARAWANILGGGSYTDEVEELPARMLATATDMLEDAAKRDALLAALGCAPERLVNPQALSVFRAAGITPPHGPVAHAMHMDRLRRLARDVPKEGSAQLCAFIACYAYIAAGNCALATCWAEHGLESDPDNRLAGVMLAVVRTLVPREKIV